MSLYVSPQNLAFTPGSTQNFTLVSTGGGLSSVTLTPQITGQITAAKVSGDNTVQLWAAVASVDGYATFPISITDAIAGETGFLNVSIAPTAAGVPTGYTSASLISMVQARTNEPNLPSQATIISFANAAVEQVELALGGIRLVGTYPTIANQTIQALGADVQEIISCSWSTGPVTAQGSLVYPMFPMPEGIFMDRAAGFPAVGFGPPVYYFLFQDTAGTLAMQLYPAAQIGQINLYYKARPILWTLPAVGNPVSTNLDTAMQEAVILWTCGRVLENRGRSAEAYQKGGFDDKYAQKIAELKGIINRRTAPKSGQVRDIMGRGYPVTPSSL